jgi:hypothetical protein
MFLSVFPNSTFTPWHWDEQAPQALAEARANGALADYSDDELFTDRLAVISSK